jgi:hypothetical protein
LNTSRNERSAVRLEHGLLTRIPGVGVAITSTTVDLVTILGGLSAMASYHDDKNEAATSRKPLCPSGMGRRLKRTVWVAFSVPNLSDEQDTTVYREREA